MNDVDVDIAVLGSGFAGSLTALCLNSIGRSVALIDKATHPRFAIGESSTPIANMVLRDLTKRYDLPQILPLCKYGTWQETCPHLTCGLKRGFSYFAQQPGEPFRVSSRHENELLVAASADDSHSDTHWLRSDVDHFLFNEARAAGVTTLNACEVLELRHASGDGWFLKCQRGDKALSVRAQFVIDASGDAGVMPQALGVESTVERMRTRSRAIFAHFRGVRSWHDMLQTAGGRVDDHPFHCDHAAQHHVLDGSWLWMLRFERSQLLCSAGLVLDEGRFPIDESMAAETEWAAWLARYPSVAEMFSRAELAESPGRFIRTGRLQRRWSQLVGPNWALLPHTAGFVDPLHSTGIAHSLCGVERLARILERDWRTERLSQALLGYEHLVQQELDLIDELVAGCFDAFNSFELFAAYSMLYFAAATTYELLRGKGPADESLGFLCANRQDFREAVRRASEARRDKSFFDDIARLVEPFNRVGLCDRAANNMYRYTVAPI
jgi:FADH2 O2-dependent halogenase